jgi:high-affinity iron transporter
LKAILRITSWYPGLAVQQAILISFREGLESFLIVGVILGYLRKTGRLGLVRGVHLGIAVSVLCCTVGAYFWYGWLQSETGGPNQSKYEGIGALVAALFVGALLWQTVRAGKRLKGQIEDRIERAAGDRADSSSWQAVLGVALVTTLLVTREGLEAVLFLGVQVFAAKALAMAIGAVLGLAGAAMVALLFSRLGNRLQIGLVLRVTSIFLALFLVQLLIYGVHELAESGMIQGSQGFHDATERFGPDGDIGRWLTFSLAGAPLLYLLLDRWRRRGTRPASAEPGAGRVTG